MTIDAGADFLRDSSLLITYDMSNVQKSWVGPPGTNLLTIDPSPTSAAGYNAAGGTGDAVSYDASKQAVKWQRNTYDVWGAYFNNNTSFTGAFTVGTTYTASFEWYAENEYPITTGTFNWELVSGGGTNYVGGAGVLGNSTYIGDGWYRFSYTFAAQNVGVSANFRVIVNDRGTSKTNFWWRKLQLEQRSSRSNFMASSRSATQSVLDTVAGREITVSNMVYNSNNTFSFNGTNTQFSFSTTGFNFANAQTIVMILKPTDNDQSRRNPYNHEYAGYGTITHEINGNFNYYHGTSGGNGAVYQGTSSGFTVLPNETAFIAVSRGALTVRWYKNGALVTSQANSYPTAVTSVSTAYIGTGYAGIFQGDIPYVALYDRQLTDTEIQTVYGALRGRYGI